MIELTLRNPVAGKIIQAASVSYSVLVLLWLVLMIATNFEGTPREQLALLTAGNPYHYIVFGCASLISLPVSIVYIVLALTANKELRLRGILAILLLGPYILLATIAYTSQLTYLPLLLSAAPDKAFDWYFNNPGSLVYFLDQLGYLFFALSGYLAGFDYITGKGTRMVTGILMYVISTLSVAAFALFAVNPGVAGTASAVGGAMTLPLAVATFIYGKKLKNNKEFLCS